jgi:N utilization substance protein B
MSGPSRRRVREFALQAIYEIEVGKSDATKVLNRYINEENLNEGPRTFLRGIVRGTLRYLSQVDEIVEKLSRGWKLERIAKVDLSILRLAIFEVLIGLKDEQITDAIIINEAVVLAKKFSGKDSGKFVNGILATLIKEKDDWRNYISRRRKEVKEDETPTTSTNP